MGDARFVRPVEVQVVSGPLSRHQAVLPLWQARIDCLHMSRSVQAALGAGWALERRVVPVPAKSIGRVLTVPIAGEVGGWCNIPGGGWGLRAQIGEESSSWMEHDVSVNRAVYRLRARAIGLVDDGVIREVVGRAQWSLSHEIGSVAEAETRVFKLDSGWVEVLCSER